jgi:hypothetical protein
MVGGIYDSQNFEQKQLKMAWSKIFFIPGFLLTKYVKIISCQRFVLKICCFKRFFSQKVRAPTCLWWRLVYSGRLGVIYDSRVTSRSSAGRWGLSQGVLPTSYWLPSCAATHFFTAIRIGLWKILNTKKDPTNCYEYYFSDLLILRTFWTTRC